MRSGRLHSEAAKLFDQNGGAASGDKQVSLLMVWNSAGDER